MDINQVNVLKLDNLVERERMELEKKKEAGPFQTIMVGLQREASTSQWLY